MTSRYSDLVYIRQSQHRPSSSSGRGYIDSLLDKQSCKITAYTYPSAGLTSIYSPYRFIPLGPIAILRYVVMTLNYYVMHMLHLTRAPAPSCICLALRSKLPVMPLVACCFTVVIPELALAPC